MVAFAILMRKILFVGYLAALIACSQNQHTLYVDDDLLTLRKEEFDRPVTTADLLNLRDIGGHFGSISVSPDGRWAAFQVQRPSTEKNDYDTSWHVLSIADPNIVYDLGDGGQVILDGEEVGFIGGARSEPKIQWSPDSQWLAFQRKSDGDVNLWRVRKDGRRLEQITTDAPQISAFRWSSDSNKLFVFAGDAKQAVQERRAKEASRGYLYDDRFTPLYSTSPSFGVAPNASLSVYALNSSQRRAATAAEIKKFNQLQKQPERDREASSASVRKVAPSNVSNRLAWLQNEDPSTFAGYYPPLTVYAHQSDGGVAKCMANECVGRIEDVFWSKRTDEVLFVRREGIRHLETAIYAWDVVKSDVRQVLKTEDLIAQCDSAIEGLVCIHEGATMPRRIVQVDTNKGTISELFDPNPEFKFFQYPFIEKLMWQNADDEDAAGHLVYPLNYQLGKRYPLVIVQYRSRGFLRGGVGNEYPILPLSAAGFFVLRFERPEKIDAGQRLGDPWAYERAYWGEGIWERTSALSALEIIIDDLAERELIDPKKVGITGLSDGAETVWYAMIHSNKFAAAAASDGGWSPIWYHLVNSGLRKNYLSFAAELPPIAEGNFDRWRLIAPEFHSDRINTPILVQVADHELIQSAPSISALKDAGQPIEAYVFSNEFHIKWQPKHKLVVYNRTIDWFNFWLRDVKDSDPEKTAQYERWHRMRHSKNQQQD